MAKTFPTRALGWHAPSDAFLTWASSELPEAATQTFPAGSPVKFASGFVAVWVSVADADILGFAYEAGGNGTAAGDKKTKVVLALSAELALEANFLAASAADNVLAATDLGTEAGLTTDANLLGTSLAGWYFEDGGTGAVIISELVASPPFASNTTDYLPAAGDTNVRLRARVKPGVSLYY